MNSRRLLEFSRILEATGCALVLAAVLSLASCAHKSANPATSSEPTAPTAADSEPENNSVKLDHPKVYPGTVPVVRKVYKVLRNDTLSDILWDQNIAPIYGKRGWVEHNKHLNPQITNWRRLLPGQLIVLEMPTDASSTIASTRIEETSIKPEEIRPEPKAEPTPEATPSPVAEGVGPPKPEKPKGPAKWFIEKELSLGFQQSWLYETQGLMETNTRGLWGFPVVNGAIGARNLNNGWTFTARARLAKQWKLNGMSFPIIWGAGVEAKLYEWIKSSDASSFSPRGGVEVETLSQATPNLFSGTPRFVNRETTILWTQAAMDWDTTFFLSQARFTLGAGFSPYTSTNATNNSTKKTMMGIKGFGSLRLYIHRNIFTEGSAVMRHLYRSDLTINAHTLGISLGWQFD